MSEDPESLKRLQGQAELDAMSPDEKLDLMFSAAHPNEPPKDPEPFKPEFIVLKVTIDPYVIGDVLERQSGAYGKRAGRIIEFEELGKTGVKWAPISQRPAPDRVPVRSSLK